VVALARVRRHCTTHPRRFPSRRSRFALQPYQCLVLSSSPASRPGGSCSLQAVRQRPVDKDNTGPAFPSQGRYAPRFRVKVVRRGSALCSHISSGSHRVRYTVPHNNEHNPTVSQQPRLSGAAHILALKLRIPARGSFCMLEWMPQPSGRICSRLDGRI
jgi:hypothetical protein